MYTCTFFGHKNSPENIYDRLKFTVTDLIENKNVKKFLVGNNGGFDTLVYKVLRELSEQHKFQFNVVLAYFPRDKYVPENSILPDGFENFPPKFALDRRNEYMLKKADFVVCYITNYIGGAGKFVEKAKKKNKTVINIA